jgi:hypothetical protein
MLADSDENPTCVGIALIRMLFDEQTSEVPETSEVFSLNEICCLKTNNY